MAAQGNEGPDASHADSGWNTYPGRAPRPLAGEVPVAASMNRATRSLHVALRRQWSRLSDRRRYAFAVICGVLVATGAAAYILPRTGSDESQTRDPRPMALDASSRIEPAKQPVVVPLRVGSAVQLASLTTPLRRELARQAAAKVAEAVEAQPRRVAVIRLLDVPLSFAAVPPVDRKLYEQDAGAEPAARYEANVANFLDDLIDAVERRQPGAILAVHGLPVEPEEAGLSLAAVQRTNDHYADVIERVGPFVPARRFVVFGSSLNERTLAGMGMREAVRLRHGRPIIFQTNRVWRALVSDEQTGRDYQLEALLE